MENVDKDQNGPAPAPVERSPRDKAGSENTLAEAGRTPHERPPLDSGLKKRIEDLIAYQGGGYNSELVEDIIVQALKLMKDVQNRGDVRVIDTAIRELRYAFKLFAPFVDRRKVTIFGSARTAPTRTEYQQCVEFARKIAEAGFMVITGAGPGIMQAGHEGAGPEMSFGANIRLPWEQSANPIMLKDKKLITFKYFFTRKLTFVRHSDAIVLFPGGFGTMDEGFEALTLMQTGKAQLMPLICMDKPGGTYWKTWDQNIKEHLLRNGLISHDDICLYQFTDDPDQAVKWITRFYRNFHSTRWVRDSLVIRLKSAPTESAIQALNEDYADIVMGEPFHLTGPTKEELDDKDVIDRPRIAFGFDRRQYGRLRQLIDTLNSF